MRRRGASGIYLTLIIIPLMAFASLASDVGHVVLVKTELQGAVDAAARTAAATLQSGGTTSAASIAAIAMAASNKVDSVSFTLQAGDITFGNYASNTFTANGSPTNAVKVTGHRNSARGTAVQLTWLAMVGRKTFDIKATSTVMEVDPPPEYGIVAVNGVNINNAFTADSYDSSAGSYAATQSSQATLANAGSWNFSNTAVIDGDLFYKSSAPVGGTVTGSRTALPASPTLTSQYPLISSVPAGATSGGNYNGGNLTLSAGDYSYTSFNINAADTLTITGGKVRIYVSGNINLNGTVNKNGIPDNLEIYNTVAAGVNLDGTHDVNAMIYAPSSPITINGSPNIYGQLIGGSFNSAGGAKVHIDQALLGGSSGGKITTVN